MAQFLSIFRPKAAESRQNRRSVHPDVVFQVLQAAFVVVDQGVRIFPVREADQVAVPGFVETHDPGQACHLGHFQQGMVVILGRTDLQILQNQDLTFPAQNAAQL